MDAYSVALGVARDEVDVCRLMACVGSEKASACADVMTLVRGDLLEGVDDTTDQFSHWLARERAAIRERFFLLAQTCLIELTKFGRASETSLKLIAERMLGFEPEREQSYRALVEAYGRNGMLDEARRIHDALCLMLQREYGSVPSPETIAVTRRVFAPRPQYGPISLPTGQVDERPRVAFLAPLSLDRIENGDLIRFFVEDVANELGRNRGFLVLAPHSSFKIDHLSGMPVDNSILRADYTVSGFIKPDRHATTLALRMTKCSGGEVIWAGEFPVDVEGLSKSFSLLSLRIAGTLCSAIEGDLLAAPRKNCGGPAYLHYLQGQKWLSACDLPRLRRARKSFKQSLDENPAFAPARARIAQTLYLEWIQVGGHDPELLNLAREQSDIALALDPNDAIGHWMKGTVALYQRDYDECEAKLAEAETLCPNAADLQVQYGDALSHLGDPDSGWRKFERAVDLNPLPPDHYWWAGASIAFHQKAFQKAIDLCGRLSDDEPVLSMLAACHALQGDLDRARIYAGRIKELFPGGMALAKSATVTPDRLEDHRRLSLEGLRLAGVV
ncbi:BTAD domain-containing putative transcriptional regulator [Mesorhizobium sp. CA5]|uniref:BTAD domain-containing putative transcriptional regulator n=1 Tax=Mesorhizobium sp. CA5 TaxID=2876638 RepID=UPI001CD0D1AE|nr:BTAD domain-containing putative transcriptional regulator [Mesorhizobium sp. CA5]MBZ9843348.1 SARP family transcriptional regulator [Mesorhizobium sp. CA5]